MIRFLYALTWLLFAVLLITGCSQTVLNETSEPNLIEPEVNPVDSSGSETAVPKILTSPTTDSNVNSLETRTAVPQLQEVVSPTIQLETEETIPMQPTMPTPSNPAIQKLIDLAKEDLAERMSTPVEQVDLVEFRNVVWPDSSLGCPEPDMAYTQVLRDGYLIRLQVGKQQYNYHGGQGRPPFLCQKPAGTENIAPSPGFNE
jgi:hypothetical protein